MSDAVERYWEGQIDTHGAHALPGTAHVDEATANAVAGFEPDHSSEPAVYPDEIPYEEPSYPYMEDDEGLEFGDDLYDEPQRFDPLAEDAGSQIRQMIREETGPDGFAEQQAKQHTAAWEMQQAQDERDNLELQRQFAADFPSHIAAAIGPRAGAPEAGEMLAPTVEALADGAATELYNGLVAEGLSHEQAIETLQPHYAQLIVAATAAARDLRGNEQIMREFRGGFRGGS